MLLTKNQLKDFHEGKETILSFLMDSYTCKLRFFASKFIKDQDRISEIISDAFINLWTNRTKFESIETIQSYLYIIVKNRCIDYKKLARNKHHHSDEYFSNLTIDEEISQKIIHTELIAMISKELEKIPTKQAEIFKLAIFEDLPTEQICKELNTTANNVYFAKSKELNSLRKSFDLKNITYYLLALINNFLS